MELPFYDRAEERRRLTEALKRRDRLVCVYGRRRLGKSRLLRETLGNRRSTYYVADERDGPLQLAALARELEPLIAGASTVVYPDWEALLARFYREAPPGAVLCIDEFPLLVRSSPELPSLLQKSVDAPSARGKTLILCGSSQRMMHGLVLDATAPLYGRASEILRLGPLEVGWTSRAFGARDAATAVAQHATWGGVPRYWELARNHRTREVALRELVLDPLGVLHREPERLILDEVDEVARTASVLALIGAGCHRLSEIAGRIGQPATSLSRVISRLLDLGFVRRDVPFGDAPKRSKRSLYRLDDPFLRLFFRCVEPERSRLGAGRILEAERRFEGSFPGLLAEEWEALARSSAGRLELFGRKWSDASRWWGNTPAGPLELDLIPSTKDDASRVLVGEVKLRATPREYPRLLDELRRKAALCPPLAGRTLDFALWVLHGAARSPAYVVTATRVVRALT